MSRFSRVALAIASVCLLLFGVSKIWLTMQPGAGLDGPDPVFSFMSRKELLVLAGGIELACAACFWLNIPASKKGLLMATLGTVVMGYRVLLIIATKQFACHCFGGLGRFLHMSDNLEAFTSISILALSIVAGHVISITERGKIPDNPPS